MKIINLMIFIISLLAQGSALAASAQARATMTVTASVTSSTGNVDNNVHTNVYMEKVDNSSSGETVVEVIL